MIDEAHNYICNQMKGYCLNYIAPLCEVQRFKGPSIYDVHTEGGLGGQAQVDAGQRHVDVHKENL